MVHSSSNGTIIAAKKRINQSRHPERLGVMREALVAARRESTGFDFRGVFTFNRRGAYPKPALIRTEIRLQSGQFQTKRSLFVIVSKSIDKINLI